MPCPPPKNEFIHTHDGARPITIARLSRRSPRAGVLGTELMTALLERHVLTGGDGMFDPSCVDLDRLAAPGFDLDYRLTDRGQRRLQEFGIDFERLPRRRPLIRYCVDWSEQRHHLAGSLGAALATRMFELGWLCRARRSRAVHVTDDGYRGLRETFGVRLDPA